MVETIRYPVSGVTPIRTLAIGAVLSALGVLVVPAILVAGYYGRVLARSAAVNFYRRVGVHISGRGHRASLDAAGGETGGQETEDGFDPSADDRRWGAEARAWRERRREERERAG